MRTFFYWLSALILILVLGLGGWLGSYLLSSSAGSGVVRVEIPQGAGVREIGEILQEQGLLNGDLRFLLLVRFAGLTTRLRAGEYAIPHGLTPLGVLRVLEQGRVVYHPVTIPEGLTVRQLAEIYGQGGWADPERLVALAADPLFARSLGVAQAGLEGYLFPDTYFLAKGTVDEAALLKMMVNRFFQVADTLPALEESGLELHQLLTLASIIEKETGAAHERPLIARVFLNRLKRKMRLQSDPTVIYAIPAFNGNLTRADLRRPTPYNTYVIKGLPPGPICNPGREAILAVLRPASSNALYFVSKNDGTHVFSSSLKAHNRAVKIFQRRKAESGQ
ncbi:endolytic transglycosylase MltG [Desulfogranum mediterraneum]|uniref:endolytic transglycosylase MltG n=1 Tax=Desulfogranum mediterraneum TaxID=160661 RepID=UPI000409D27F|nr:endolytic transglycosylase MltG [Desulfogranum mediterraneum]